MTVVIFTRSSMKINISRYLQLWVQSLIILMIIFFSIDISAKKINVREIPFINHLPVNIINTVYQDSEGYIWYGTEEGLCRYDGYEIHTFRVDFRTQNIPFKSNSITCIAEDSLSNRLWLGTKNGVYQLNKLSYEILPVKIINSENLNIESIHVTSEGEVWIGTPQRIYRIKREGNVFEYPLQCIKGAGKGYVLFENNEGQILLSLSEKGLFKYNRGTDKFEIYFPYKDRINDVIQDKIHNCYWLASWHHSIIRLDPENPDSTKQYVFQNLPTNISGKIARTALNIVQDDVFNYIWITSWSDMFVFKVNQNGMLERVDTSGFLPKQNKALRNIIKDRNGNLWVTALDNNDFLVSFEEENIETFNIKPLKSRINWTPAIVSLCKDDKGVFWLFQRRSGLLLYDPLEDKIANHTDCDETKGLPLTFISFLLKSRTEDIIWVASEGQNTIYGLKQEALEMKVRKKIDLSTASVYPGNILCLFEDKDSNIWITTNTGIFMYSPGTDSVKLISNDYHNVSELSESDQGIIWGVQKNKGLIRIGRDKKISLKIEDRDIVSVASNETGHLWLATSKGELLTLDPNTNVYTDYSKICGMNGDMINDIIVDGHNHVWIVTSLEIKEFIPESQTYRTYAVANENIDFIRFLPKSHFLAEEDEKIYFGGIPGFMSVSTVHEPTAGSMTPSPKITDVRIMGNSIYFNERTGKKSESGIDLQPGEQNIEIHFSTLDYQNTPQIRYAYRLSGIDDDWIYLPAGKNVALYNKLSKGNYTFEVKATDKDGMWSDNVTRFGIHRLPEYYETWWAYIVYTIIILAIAFYIYRTIRNRIRLRNELHVRELEQAKSEEVNHAKLQFFTNITHELLTPLTILSASVEELRKEAPAYKSKYTVMANNINRLIRLLQQILEFRKAETGNLKLKVSANDVSVFVERCVESFRPLIRKKRMIYEFSCSKAPFIAYFDPDKLDKILYNLLSNAAKYSVADGKVCVSLGLHPEKEGYLQLIVADNGPGISHDAQKDLFKRFYEGKYRNFKTIGTGIGLSLVKDLVQLHHGSISVVSEEGQGASFIISLPYEKGFYSSEEIDTEIPSCADEVLQPEQNPKDAEPVEEIENKTACSKDKKYNLLVVEDNEELLYLIERLLSVEYNVHTASNGKEGLSVVANNDIHLIISDVMMPVMDGIEFCRSIKGSIDTSHIPVILLTAKNQEEDKVEAYESGADGFINKPFSLSVLHARIRNLLSTREKMTKQFRKQLVFEAQDMNYTSMDEDFLKKAISCVESHLDDPDFNQQQFADELNISRSTSFRKLKSLTGLNFPAFVNNIRMKAACRIMEENKNVKVSEVAYAVGYNDPRYFTVCFKKEIGVTPLEYLERIF